LARDLASVPLPAGARRRGAHAAELRQLAHRFRNQQAVQASEGELVVEQARRLASEFALPEHFFGEEGFVEMEAAGGAQQN
jgi:hypothetical protein